MGLTFQQVQKYERGSNRISASKLFEIARALQVPIGWFFEGLNTARGEDGALEGGEAPFGHSFLTTQEGIDLANLFPSIRKRRVRRRLVDLVRAMVEDENDVEAVEALAAG